MDNIKILLRWRILWYHCSIWHHAYTGLNAYTNCQKTSLAYSACFIVVPNFPSFRTKTNPYLLTYAHTKIFLDFFLCFLVKVHIDNLIRSECAFREQAETVTELTEACAVASFKTTPIQVQYCILGGIPNRNRLNE